MTSPVSGTAAERAPRSLCLRASGVATRLVGAIIFGIWYAGFRST